VMPIAPAYQQRLMVQTRASGSPIWMYRWQQFLCIRPCAKGFVHDFKASRSSVQALVLVQAATQQSAC
jgi:hypothetical protein